MQANIKLLPQGHGVSGVLPKRAAVVVLDWDTLQKSRCDTEDSQGSHLDVFLDRGTVVRGGGVLVAEDGSLTKGRGVLRGRGAVRFRCGGSSEIAVIEGPMSQAVPFTVRLSIPANYRIPARMHSAVERITVLSGEFFMGIGDRLDPEKSTGLKVGAVMIMAAGTRHFAWTRKATVVQLNSTGYGASPTLTRTTIRARNEHQGAATVAAALASAGGNDKLGCMTGAQARQLSWTVGPCRSLWIQATRCRQCGRGLMPCPNPIGARLNRAQSLVLES